MKRIWKIVGIATLFAILGVAAVGAVAYAQDDGEGVPFDFAGKFKEALVDILGVTVEEYDNAVDQARGQVVDEAKSEGWLTDDQAEMLQWRWEQAPDMGMRGMGRGFDKCGPAMLGRGDNLASLAADALDLSLTDLLTELQDGKSIADVAGEKGVDTQVIIDAYTAQLKEKLDGSVTEGRITQKQADYQLEQATERVTQQIENTWTDGFRGGRHGGDRMGFPELGGF
jgi:hypothetical protein